MAKVEDSKLWKAFWFMYRALDVISLAEGYNTNMYVTHDPALAMASLKRYTSYYSIDFSGPQAHEVGGPLGPRVYHEMNYVVEAVAMLKTEHPFKEAFRMEQDLRNAITASMATIRSKVGSGFILRWGDCVYDSGLLLPDEKTGLVLKWALTYPQGDNW